MRRAVYAGSFDPLTNGHLWMIAQGRLLFDELVVAIGENPEKHCLFSLPERLAMLEESISVTPGVRIASFSNQFLVHYAQSIEATFILRGVRDTRDFEYERTMRHLNADLHPDITTVFLIPPRELAEISSSVVKSLIGPQGWQVVVQRYVPEPVYQQLLRVEG